MKKLLLLLVLLSLNLQGQKIHLPASSEPVVQQYLKEYYDASRFYRVQVIDKVDALKQVQFVDADLNFFGEVRGDTMILNRELLKYENLLWIALNREYGQLYNLKEVGHWQHSIMSTCWRIDPDHEQYAKEHRAYPYIKEEFFTALQKKEQTPIRL